MPTPPHNPSDTKTSRDSLTAFARSRLEQLEAKDQKRELVSTTRHNNGRATRAGKDVVSFCDNDYLSLTHDPRLIEAANTATKQFGAGAGAARLITGNTPLNEQLERAIANLKKCEAARVFGSGYLANIGTIPMLVGQGDLILIDELSHSCMYMGAKLSGAKVVNYKHNNLVDAQRILEENAHCPRKLVLTETVFSMDGDLAPLGDLAELCEQHDAWLMTDDAHGLGVVSQQNPAPIQMGTFSKAAGGYGGYVCATQPVADLITSRARSFVYTTALPPGVLASNLAALRIFEAEPQRGQQVLRLAKCFADELKLPTPNSAIIAIHCGAEERALKLSDRLLGDGFLVTAIRPPTVPDGTARLRVTINFGHTETDVKALATALKNHMDL